MNTEKKQLQQSQHAFLNILEDMDVEKNKLAAEKLATLLNGK